MREGLCPKEKGGKLKPPERKFSFIAYNSEKEDSTKNVIKYRLFCS